MRRARCISCGSRAVVQVVDSLVHQWRRGRGANPLPVTTSTSIAESAPQFIALSLPPPSPAPPTSVPAPVIASVAVAAEAIHLEFKRGARGVSVIRPVSAATY